ncbi:hypothetical protein FNV43_RR13152 [Rhamnella rubrinervis]|uniref:Uncharacterized protein n=1 Tax=Rhamnella rubrinervis TaxID=2594499 RepID=A0A8K0H0M0_9ROSA|nr:hypothetical protein FNV43_RR13152 [Rhamnella rubrinervis]
MNIHRKDKAKLRQASSNVAINETPPPPPPQQQQQHQQPNLDIPKMSTSNSPIPLEPKPTIPRWPWFLTSEAAATDHHANTSLIRAADQNRVGDHQLVHQLPLFAETPPDHHKDQKPAADHNHHLVDHVNIEKGLSSSSSSSGSELDLELRLGPEPQDTSPPAIGTRKFF